MASITQKLHKKGLIHPPPWLPLNTMYETIMGSTAYGCADTSVKKNRIADTDVYGFCIPPKDVVFPHLAGRIAGFGTHPPSFEQYQKHGIRDTPDGVPEGITYEEVIQELQKRGEI